MTPKLDFRPAGKANFRALSRIFQTLTPQQQTYLAHNAYSMLQAIYEPDSHFAFGIYEGDTPVGFILYDYDPDDETWGISRFMIGAEYQGKGYGRAAMIKLLDHLWQTHQPDKVYISFVEDNLPAKHLYSSIGFVDTGMMDDDEMIYVYTWKADET